MDPLSETSPRPESSGLAPILQSFVFPIARAWKLLVLAGVAGGILGVGVAVTRPDSYASTGKLLVKFGEREQSSAEATVQGAAVPARTGREDLANEIQLLNDPTVYERVARQVGPVVILRPFDPAALDDARTSSARRWFHRFQSWWHGRGDRPGPWNCDDAANCRQCIGIAARAVAGQTTIGPIPNSNVIVVSHTTHDPETAQKVVAALLVEMMARHREVFSTDSAFEFLKAEAERLREESTIADRGLSEYRKTCGIYDLAAQRLDLLEHRGTLEQEIAQDLVRARTLEEKFAVYFQLFPTVSPTESRPAGRELIPNPLRTVLETQLLTLQHERLELVLKYPNQENTDFKVKDSLIADVKARLEAAPALLDLGESLAVERNPAYDRIRQALEDSYAELRSLQSGRIERERRVEELGERLQRLQQCEPDLLRLDREAATKRAAAANVEEALERTRLKNELDKDQITNLRVLADASDPFDKVGPRRSRIVALGVFAGVVLGAGFAFLRHTLRRALAAPRDAERDLRLPVLTVVPESHDLGAARPAPTPDHAT